MKVCQKPSAPTKTRIACRFCSKLFVSLKSVGLHQVRDHQDTWAVIDMMEAGVSQEEANRYYERSIRQATKNYGSYYLRTNKTENCRPSVSRGSSWMVDDNIFYDSDQDRVEEGGEEGREEDLLKGRLRS